MTYTKESLAALLHGREYGDEITNEEERDVKASGLVVVFGYSDDAVELRGAIHDETNRVSMLSRAGVVPIPDREEEDVLRKFGVLGMVANAGKRLQGNWDCGGYSWTYSFDVPHATFDIMDEGEKYCRGIVFNLSDLPQ